MGNATCKWEMQLIIKSRIKIKIKFKKMKIKIFLLAFTRTSPLNAGVSRISLTSINLPGGQFKSSDNSNTSSLPCTAAAAQRLA